MQNINRKVTPMLASVLLLSVSALAHAIVPESMQVPENIQVPESIQVPEGNTVAWETVGVGDITYECRDKPDAASELGWVFVGPEAVLNDSDGKPVGRYFGPPATWQAPDGSKVTGTQLAVASGGTGNIPYQLVQANPAVGEGVMSGVTYITRLNTQGGVAPALACGEANKGERQVVQYQADYTFWKAN